MRRVLRCVPPEFEPYRYVLEVALREDEAPKLAVVIKNPSTATGERSDPTIGKVEAWARRHGYGSIICVNLFARRATDPRQLNDQPYVEIVGPENDQHILEAIEAADVIAVGWGNPNGTAPDMYDRRVAEVLRLLANYPLHVVGPLTQGGYPRHGLLWNSDCALADWPITSDILAPGPPTAERGAYL